MADYDISQAFKEIENELIDSMMRSFSRHRAEETAEGYNWSQWQAEQLKSLEQYRKKNSKKFNQKFSEINGKVEEMLRTARTDGNAEQEAEILQAIKDGFKIPDKPSESSTGEFFKVNDRKLDALIKSTTDDLKKAETAVLRMSNDKYRKAIFNAQVYANSGAGTYEKAVDMACRDMLKAGLNCVEYKNGARHTLEDYAEMAIRTANKRAYLRGEGEKRQELGITTVVVNSRQGGCSDCAKYIGKVFIDDVYSGGKSSDGNYPLLSKAIENGLFHPRCKDSTSTYYEGITTLKPVTPEEMAEMDKREKLEQQKSYYDNQAKKNQRIADYSLDEDNKRIYQHRAKQSKQKADEIEKKLDEVVAKSAESDIIKIEEKPLSEKLKNYKQLKMTNEVEYYKWQNGYYKKNEPRINKTDISSIKEYSDGSYVAINGVERFEKGSEPYKKICKKYNVTNLDRYKLISDRLSSAISKFTLDDNLITHRYVPNIDYITDMGSTVNDIVSVIGKNYQDKGYFSTCLFENQTKHFGGRNPIHLKILVPKGTDCAYINKFSEKKDLEFELLLNRGTKFKIVDGGEEPVKMMRWDSKLHKMVEKEEKEKYMTLEVIK